MQDLTDFSREKRFSRFGLGGKAAVVTGGAGAIGSAVARGLAEHGADVALLDFQPERAEEAAEPVRATGRRAIALGCDCRDDRQIDEAVARTIAEFGRIDVLVHTAGYNILSPLLEMSRQQFEEVLAAFLVSSFLLAKAAAQEMIRRQSGGSIVLISSISSTRALGRGTGAYAAAKAGLNALVRESAVEWAPYGIRVNAVAPCQIKTPSLDVLLDSGLHGGRETLLERMISRIPLGRLGEPEEIVGPCLFLASPSASLVTGQVVFVDGGYTTQ